MNMMAVPGKTVPGTVMRPQIVTPAPSERVLDPSTTQNRDYGTKSFPWASASSSTSTPVNSSNNPSSSSFLSHPITPPNEEVGLDQIPRHIPSVDMSDVNSLSAGKENSAPTTEISAKKNEQTVTPIASPEAVAPSTTHLSRLLKRKQLDVGDLDDMVKESVKRDPRGHLFAGESDASDVDDADDALMRKKEEMKLPSVAKFKRMMQESMKDNQQNGQASRERHVGSGIRILANFN